MSQLYLHRLKVKQHSKHWLNFSLFHFFGWFFSLRLIMFWRNFHSVFLFSVSKGYTSSVARSVSICFVSNFGFFDKHLTIIAKQVLVALKIVVVFHQNIKRRQFFLLAASLFCRWGDSIHLFRFLSFFPSSGSFNIGNWFRHSLVQSFGEH